MIAHVVLFQPRLDLQEGGRQDLGQALSAALAAIPSIRRARVGRRVTHGGAYERLMGIDYACCAVLEFDDLQGLQDYLAHPAHERLAQCFFESIENALMYDFDLEDGEDGLAQLLMRTEDSAGASQAPHRSHDR